MTDRERSQDASEDEEPSAADLGTRSQDPEGGGDDDPTDNDPPIISSGG